MKKKFQISFIFCTKTLKIDKILDTLKRKKSIASEPFYTLIFVLILLRLKTCLFN